MKCAPNESESDITKIREKKCLLTSFGPENSFFATFKRVPNPNHKVVMLITQNLKQMFIFTVDSSLLFRLLIGSVGFKLSQAFLVLNMILKVSVFVIGLFVSALSGEKERDQLCKVRRNIALVMIVMLNSET